MHHVITPLQDESVSPLMPPVWTRSTHSQFPPSRELSPIFRSSLWDDLIKWVECPSVCKQLCFFPFVHVPLSRRRRNLLDPGDDRSDSKKITLGAISLLDLRSTHSARDERKRATSERNKYNQNFKISGMKIKKRNFVSRKCFGKIFPKKIFLQKLLEKIFQDL